MTIKRNYDKNKDLFSEREGIVIEPAGDPNEFYKIRDRAMRESKKREKEEEKYFRKIILD